MSALKKKRKREKPPFFNSAAGVALKLQRTGFLLDLEDLVVEVILKGFAVFRVLLLLLELFVGLGAGAAARPLALLLRLVPLLLLVAVHLSGHP